VAAAGLAALWLAAAQPGRAEGSDVAVKAAKAYVGDGRIVEDAVILIRNGRIRSVAADAAVPEGVPVIEVEGARVTPGLIDANARIEPTDLIPPSRSRTDRAPDAFISAPPPGDFITELARRLARETDPARLGRFEESPAQRHVPGDDPVEDHLEEDGWPLVSGVRSGAVISEQSAEVVPHTRVLDALDFRSPDFDRLVRGGVTTVYASPDASAVIGPRGAVLRTAGALENRVLVPAAAVKAVIGADPYSLGVSNRRPGGDSFSLYARRPNSGMGVTWVFRKAFYDAIRRGKGLPAYGGDTAKPEASAVLGQVLQGKVSLRIQARIQKDILTALRLTEEFQTEFTLEEATEAYLCLDELKARSVPVIFGPIYERRGGTYVVIREGRKSRYHTFRELVEAGIETALSAQEFREEDGLARQAMYAMRFGASFDDTLRAVTQTPARLLGIDKELGTLEAGKRADLIVWSGRPFAATSMPAVVLIDGEVVVDRR
jgi:imidazolonepropionase-like amidohydrolase